MSFDVHPWKIVLHGNDAEQVEKLKQLSVLGNGYMGMNGAFEEEESACTWLAGLEIADCERPRSVRCMNLQGVRVEVDGEALDLHQADIRDFSCELDLQTGIFVRRFKWMTAKGSISFRMERFVSMAQKELLAIRCTLRPDYEAHIAVTPFLDARASDEGWENLAEEESEDGAAILVRIREDAQSLPCVAVGAAMSCWTDGLELINRSYESGYTSATYAASVEAGDEIMLEKHVLCFTSCEYEQNVLTTVALRAAARARELGFDEMKDAQIGAWKARWASCDVRIDGDEAAQQQIRYAIFRLWSAYSGEEMAAFTLADRTGALPFYLSASEADTAKQLLFYSEGTVERQAALAHALFAYATCAGDLEWLRKDGLSILCAIARFFHRKASELARDAWQGRMAAWCIGLFLTQMHRASPERIAALDLTKTETAEMMELVTRLHCPQRTEAAPEELYYLNHLFDAETFRSLYENCDLTSEPQDAFSACVRCILAAQAHDGEKSLEMMRRTVQIALESPADWAACWQAIVHGFGGMRMTEEFCLRPILPEAWNGYGFRTRYRGRLLEVNVQPGKVQVELLDGQPLTISLYDEEIRLVDRVERTL